MFPAAGAPTTLPPVMLPSLLLSLSARSVSLALNILPLVLSLPLLSRPRLSSSDSRSTRPLAARTAPIATVDPERALMPSGLSDEDGVRVLERPRPCLSVGWTGCEGRPEDKRDDEALWRRDPVLGRERRSELPEEIHAAGLAEEFADELRLRLPVAIGVA
jgi:hypothetical protein